MQIDSPEAVYRQHGAAGRLVFQNCLDCGEAIFYVRAICPKCGSQRLAFSEATGRGKIETYAVAASATADGQPRTAVIVGLEEGIRVMGNLVGAIDYDNLIGCRVRLDAAEPGSNAFPAFRIDA